MKKPILYIFASILATASLAQPATLRLRSSPSNSQSAVALDGNPTGNSKGTLVIADWTSGGGVHIWRSFLKFDLSSIPSTSIIDSAFLSLYANPHSPSGNVGHPTWGTDNSSAIFRITSTWDSATICWNNQPTVNHADSVILAQSTGDTQNYVNINVKTLVQSMITSGGRYGFFIKHNQETTPLNSMIFYGPYDYSTDTAKTPLLIIKYRNTVAIESIAKNEERFNISPNPADGSLVNINIKKEADERIEIAVYDYVGKLVSSIQLNDNALLTNTPLNITNYPKGIYLVKIISSYGYNSVKQLIVNR